MGNLILSELNGSLAPIENVIELVLRETDLERVFTFSKAIEAAKKVDGKAIERRNYYSELSIWTSRHIGELIRLGQEKGEIAARGGDRKSNSQNASLISLKDLGLNHDQSARAKQIASIREEVVREYLQSNKDGNKEISKNGLMKYAKQAKVNELQPCELIEGVVSCLSEINGQKFGTIYADPPWKYGNQGTRASTNNHYQTMTVDELCELPIGELACERSHLWLWTTNGFLFECPRLFDAWGFEFKSSYIWVKPQIGIGNYLRNSHEFLLLGVRGGLTANAKNVRSWGEFDRKKHSAKPEKIRRDVIEKISNGPFLELFGRKQVSGWTVFGNQIEQSLF